MPGRTPSAWYSIGDTPSVERRFFLNSITADATRFASAVRGHWSVENRLHWRLDVIFSEDASRIRKGNVPAILTSIRHLCMNLFECESSSLRLSQKRRKALGMTITALRLCLVDNLCALALENTLALRSTGSVLVYDSERHPNRALIID
jgi:hypothetical protein